MCRLGVLLVTLATILGSGCGGGGNEAIAPKEFAPPPTEEPTMLGGKGKPADKGPNTAD